jgi:hypothetical protein
MVQLLSMVRFLEKINFTKTLGLSLGVNRVWIERSDRAPNGEYVAFIDIRPKRAGLKNKIKCKFDHSSVFFCLHLLDLQFHGHYDISPLV